MAARRVYSEDVKAAALMTLDENGGNLLKTAKETGVPYATLHEWKSGRGINAAVSEVRYHKRGSLIERYEELRDLLLDKAKQDYKGASFRDIMGAIHILHDKIEALKRQPTNFQSIAFTEQEIELLRREYDRLFPAPPPIEGQTIDVAAEEGETG